MRPKTIFVLIVVILFLIIILQNTQVVTLRFFFWEISMSQIILLLSTALIGLVVGYIIAEIKGHRHKE